MSKHGAAIHFLELSIKRLDATLEILEAGGQKETQRYRDMEKAKADILDSVQTLKAIGWVEDKADEIRRRERKPQNPAEN